MPAYIALWTLPLGLSNSAYWHIGSANQLSRGAHTCFLSSSEPWSDVSAGADVVSALTDLDSNFFFAFVFVLPSGRCQRQWHAGTAWAAAGFRTG